MEGGNLMKNLTIKIINKKMKKLEKRYNKTPKECAITRCVIEKRMQKLEKAKIGLR